MRFVSRLGQGLALMGMILGAAPASAQQPLIDLVPRQDLTDERGVDMSNSTYRHREQLLSIGTGGRPLDLSLSLTSPGVVQDTSCAGGPDIGHTISFRLSSNAYLGNTAATALYTAVLPHQSGRLGIETSSGGNFPLIVTPEAGNHATGTFDPTHAYFNYIGPDGTEATYSIHHAAHPFSSATYIVGNVDLIRYPDGETWTYRYNDINTGGGVCSYGKISRVRSIVSSRGYAIQFDYAADPTGTVSSASTIRDFLTVVRATAYNKSAVYCDETLLQSCASVTALNSAATFGYDRGNNRVNITKANGETVELTFGTLMDTVTLTNVARPSGVSRTMVYDGSYDDYGTYRYLSSLTEAGRTWYYGFSASWGGGMTGVTEPSGAQTLYWIGGDTPYFIMDPLNRQSSVGYDSQHRLVWLVQPEGNEFTATADARGNIYQVRHAPKPGPTLPTLQASAVFPSSCPSTDRRSCNLPTSQTDFSGNTTDYTYDAAHGGVLTATGPSVNGVRPQTRHSYAQRYAWVSNGSGGYSQVATSVWVRTATSSCRTSAATGNPSAPCATAGDEVLTQYDYGPDSGPNNLLLRGQTVTATDGGVATTLRTCYGYDANGRRISETSANANLTSCP